MELIRYLPIFLLASMAQGQQISPGLVTLMRGKGDLAKAVRTLDTPTLNALIKWTEDPGPNVLPPTARAMQRRLVEALGQSKETRAIPYLADHLDFDPNATAVSRFWRSEDSYILHYYPWADALLRIGSAARVPLINRFDSSTHPESRLLIIFLVSRLGKSDDAIQFLRSVHSNSEDEAFRLNEGLAIQRGVSRTQ